MAATRVIQSAMANTKACPSCNNDIPGDSRFCPQCGTPQALSCAACGRANAPGSRFCSQCGVKLGQGAPAAPPAAVTAPPTASPRAAASAERRQITVMFCDLVGSTALSTRLDPEDLREVIAAYHKSVAQVVTGFGGYVAKYMGDGVLVYFGYPEASETAAENAVRAALALIGAVSQLVVAGIRHEVRVGLATGLVVVGELVGAGEAQERNVVGETPNLAARLQSAAAPNTVVIAATTHGDLFEDLKPSVHVHKRFGQEIQINYCSKEAAGECSLIREMKVEQGSIGDWRKLSGFHYRGHNVAVPRKIFRLMRGEELCGVIYHISL